MSEKYTAIVLSAGSGSRMKSSVPKQYMDLLGKPVLYYSLFAFQTSDVDEIILVTGAKDIEYCRKQIVDKYSLTKVKHIVPGGDERYKSVYEGLKAAKGADRRSRSVSPAVPPPAPSPLHRSGSRWDTPSGSWSRPAGCPPRPPWVR